MLGAGLDTFAYRHPLATRLKVFEVDHPATQAWKRRRLAETAVAAPDTLTYAPVDFERDRLLDGLTAAGFDPNARALLHLAGRRALPDRSGDPFEVCRPSPACGTAPRWCSTIPTHHGPWRRNTRPGMRERARSVAALGEPWLSHFEPANLRTLLLSLGYATVEDLGPAELVERYLSGAGGSAPKRGGHVVFART
ncbi:class I SAM-dependent methyltransferase [Caulobacter segnis]